MGERVQKLLARAGYGSRRACEVLITTGRVTINGKLAELGSRADPLTDTVAVDGQVIRLERLRYIMLNKPKGVLSSSEDELQQGRPTVRDLVDLPGHLFEIGRLDMNSEGLMILTNDGELAHKLTHPRYGHSKTYRVWVERRPSQEDLDRWAKGVELDGVLTAPCTVTVVDDSKYVAELKIVMREGRKRQIRRVAALLGHPVRRLLREQIGPVRLSGVTPGHWRDLTDGEIKALRKSVAPKDKARRPAARRRAGGAPPASGRDTRPARDARTSRERRPDRAGGRPRPPRRNRGDA